MKEKNINNKLLEIIDFFVVFSTTRSYKEDFMKVFYSTQFNPDTGEVESFTPCPRKGEAVKVGSDDCVRCADFSAIMLKRAVECRNNQ